MLKKLWLYIFLTSLILFFSQREHFDEFLTVFINMILREFLSVFFFACHVLYCGKVGFATTEFIEECLQVSGSRSQVPSLTFFVDLLCLFVLLDLFKYASSKLAIIMLQPLHAFLLLDTVSVLLTVRNKVISSREVSRTLGTRTPLEVRECKESCLHAFENLYLKSGRQQKSCISRILRRPTLFFLRRQDFIEIRKWV